MMMNNNPVKNDHEETQTLERGEIFAWISIILGVLGMCTPIIPPCGVLFAFLSILMGYLGRKSSRYGLAVSGMVLGVMILSGTGLVIIMAVVFNYEEFMIVLNQLIQR